MTALFWLCAAVLSADPPSEGPVEAQVFAKAKGQLGMNTRFETPSAGLGPDLFDLRGKGSLGVEAKLGERTRVRVEARGRWRGTTEAGFRSAAASFEPFLGEAYVDFYRSGFDLRAGSQYVPLGANPLLAPADVLNPVDLRESLFLSDPEDLRLPVPAFRLKGELDRWSYLVAYVPFFEPDRFTVVGHNDSLIQPGLGLSFPFLADPSVADRLEPSLLETRRPQADGLGDLALAVTTQIERAKVGIGWLTGYEKLPAVTVDPELASFIGHLGQPTPPLSPAEALSLENRFRAGEALFQGEYLRRHLFWAQGSRVVGPAQIDIDLAVSPSQTFVDQSLVPLRKSALTYVIGLTPARESAWTYAVSYLGLGVLGLKPSESLLWIEPSGAGGVARSAFLHLLVGSVSRRWFDDDLEVGVRGVVDPVRASIAVALKASYKLTERLLVWGGSEIYLGDALSPLGYFRRNDQVLIGAQAELF